MTREAVADFFRSIRDQFITSIKSLERYATWRTRTTWHDQAA